MGSLSKVKWPANATRFIIVAAILTFLAGAGVALRQQSAWALQAGGNQYPADSALTDAVASLQTRLARGEVRLQFDPRYGYLRSVLAELEISVASQSLVFSKTSLQTDFISPTTPRALYFNDDVYVGWVPDAPMLEIISIDPKYGTIFYVLDQAESKSPAFRRLSFPCMSCHGPSRDDVPSPLLLVMSVAPDAAGDPIGDFELISDRTPPAERWGGWYVSARAGAAHLGNRVIAGGVARTLENPSSPSTSVNTSRYLTPHSDIVALTVLSHQVEVHNRMSEASLQTRVLAAGSAADRIADAVEPLVRALLFSGAAPFSGSLQGTSEFAQQFSAKGRKDRRGRSLKDLDLERRLLRYPLSYLIYSESFDGMPAIARNYVYRRLREILSGKDRTKEYQHLSATDRSALLEILSQTKPEFKRE
jgi:hypothetical protein